MILDPDTGRVTELYANAAYCRLAGAPSVPAHLEAVAARVAPPRMAPLDHLGWCAGGGGGGAGAVGGWKTACICVWGLCAGGRWGRDRGLARVASCVCVCARARVRVRVCLCA